MKEILKSKNVLVEVNGFNIMSDTLYEVVGKHDGSAPQAFQDANIAKAPFPENATHVCCPWDDFSEVYNTGFIQDQDVIMAWIRMRLISWLISVSII